MPSTNHSLEKHNDFSSQAAALESVCEACVRAKPCRSHCAAALLCLSTHAQQPERQLPADQRAYRAVLSIADPAKRLTALRTFSVGYQDSKYFDSVQDAALRLLLQSFPTRTVEIRDQVQVNIANADKGYQRAQEQSTEADLLADAGVQLPLAQKLAEDANRTLTEAVFLRGMAKLYGELEAEMPTPDELHGQYTEARASTLLALGARVPAAGQGGITAHRVA